MNKENKKEGRVVLSVKNLSKKYGDRVAVDDLTFHVREGEILGFLGSNGAGKSTTMKMITGIANATSGQVYICGNNLEKNFEKAVVNLGAMVEAPAFYPYLTGYQNLKYFASLYPNITRQMILDVADLVGLSMRINEKVKNYSLGMKQRLGIAQALLHNPKVLILDEPTNGLDANGIREIKIFLKRIAKEKNTAIMISSHILAIMEDVCDKICIIDKGKIVETKSLEDIKRSYTAHGTHYIKTNAPNYAAMLLFRQFDIVSKISGNKILLHTNETDLARIIVKLTEQKIPIFGAGEITYSLEEIFLNVVGNDGEIK